jgi:hypothetical protein
MATTIVSLMMKNTLEDLEISEVKLSVSEALAKIDKQEDHDEKVALLREQPDVLQMLFQYAMDPRVVWLFPEEDPPYKPTEFLDQQANLWQNIRKLYRFCKGGDDSLPQLKREMMFIQMLEMLDPQDAKLLLAIKNKILPYETVTYELIKEAFPHLDLQGPMNRYIAPTKVPEKGEKPVSDYSKRQLRKAEREAAQNLKNGTPMPVPVHPDPKKAPGFMWVTDGITDLRVAPNFTIPDGWRRGRGQPVGKKKS